MLRGFFLVFVGGWGLLAPAVEPPPWPPGPADPPGFLLTHARVQKIDTFSMTGCGFGGMATEGKVLFDQIARRPDALEQFVTLYGFARGHNEAQAYALVGFYYLDPPLYAHIKGNYQLETITLKTCSGCMQGQETLGSVVRDLEAGAFNPLVPTAWVKTPENKSAGEKP